MNTRHRSVVVSCAALAGVSTVIPFRMGTAAAAAAPSGAGAGKAQGPRALVPVRSILSRHIDAAPGGADALRVSILGDGTGGRLQIRLLAPGEDGVLTGYFAPPDIPIDFKGWKTLVLPLSAFTFHSDHDPALTQDGTGSVAALTSAAALQIAMTSAATRVFVDDLGWTKADAAPTDPLLAVIDSFDSPDAKANWKPVGDFNEQRAVEYSINQVPTYVKNGSGSLQMVVRSKGQAELQLNEPQLVARLKNKAALPYVLFARPPFEPITPDTTPAVAEIQATLNLKMFASPGETEPTTFAVYTGLPLKNATVSVQVPFSSARKAILPSSALDMHVVKVGVGSVDTPMLLMKDDRQPLSGLASRVRLTGSPATDIPQASSKQFWITVRVPQNQAPGLYTGKLAFTAEGVKPSSILLTIEVLPVELRTPHFQYGIDLPTVLQASSGSDALPGERVVTPDEMKAQLTDIHDHGFSIVALHGKGQALTDALKLYKDAGFSLRGPVVVATPQRTSDEVSAVEAARSAAGIPPTFEIYYNMPGSVAHSMDEATRYAAGVRQANRNALVVTSVDSGGSYGELTRSVGDTLAPVYSVSSDYAQKVLKEGRRFTSNRDYWAWDISRESPVRDRLLSGFLLFKTGNGLYGAFPGPYQQISDGVDPYAVFTEPAGNTTPSGDTVRPDLVAYPVEGGVLDTIQWEAVREGIDDIRYTDALKTKIRELKDLKYRKDATDYAESYLIGMVSKPFLALTPKEHQELRRVIADQTVKLQDLVAKAPKPKD